MWLFHMLAQLDWPKINDFDRYAPDRFISKYLPFIKILDWIGYSRLDMQLVDQLNLNQQWPTDDQTFVCGGSWSEDLSHLAPIWFEGNVKLRWECRSLLKIGPRVLAASSQSAPYSWHPDTTNYPPHGIWSRAQPRGKDTCRLAKIWRLNGLDWKLKYSGGLIPYDP